MIKRTAKPYGKVIEAGQRFTGIGQRRARENIPSPPVLRTAWEPAEG